MPVTTNGIWYPEPGQNYNIPATLATMASSIENKLGPWAVSQNGIAGNAVGTALAGWQLVAAEAAIEGKGVQVFLRVKRTGAAITVPATGNIVNSNVVQLVASLKPLLTTSSLSSTHTGRMGAGNIDANGLVTITAVVPGANIGVNEEFTLGGYYIKR